MITSISLQHFRSYDDESFEFEPGVNFVVGPNASGKTNLLEAILVACQGSSYRTTDKNLIQKNLPWARLEATTNNNQRRIFKFVKEHPDAELIKKTIEIDDKKLLRLTHAYRIPVVLFEPNHLQQIASSPEQRRLYVDMLLEQTDPSFATLRRNYIRTLAQRNALLKKGSANVVQQLFPWDIRLSELGGAITTKRQQVINELNETLSDGYSQIAGKKHHVNLTLETALPLLTYGNSMLKELEKRHQLDMVRGYTSVGPHRDDIGLWIDGNHLQGLASRGEIRTLLIALKIQETKSIEEKRGQKPLLLLDDVFGELDGKRRKLLTEFLHTYQTFITTTDADVVIHNFAQHCRTIAL